MPYLFELWFGKSDSFLLLAGRFKILIDCGGPIWPLLTVIFSGFMLLVEFELLSYVAKKIKK